LSDPELKKSRKQTKAFQGPDGSCKVSVLDPSIMDIVYKLNFNNHLILFSFNIFYPNRVPVSINFVLTTTYLSCILSEPSINESPLKTPIFKKIGQLGEISINKNNNLQR